MSYGPVVRADDLKLSTASEIRALSDAAADLLGSAELETLQKLKSSISEENKGVYIRALAALGDAKAAEELLKHVDELIPEEQATILLSVAKSHKMSHLEFLLTKYGKHPEVDDAIKSHIPLFRGLQGVYDRYTSEQGQRRAAFLELPLNRFSTRDAADQESDQAKRGSDASEWSDPSCCLY